MVDSCPECFPRRFIVLSVDQRSSFIDTISQQQIDAGEIGPTRRAAHGGNSAAGTTAPSTAHGFLQMLSDHLAQDNHRQIVRVVSVASHFSDIGSYPAQLDSHHPFFH
jgi:hypothetical protein